MKGQEDKNFGTDFSEFRSNLNSINT